MKKTIAIVNGPNLDLLGVREPAHYGRQTLQSIEEACTKNAASWDLTVSPFSQTARADLIDFIHRGVGPDGAPGEFDAIVINPGAYTHYSYAIRDALAAVSLPAVEVHISNVHRREEFRHQLGDGGGVCRPDLGLGSMGYLLAIEALAQRLKEGE